MENLVVIRKSFINITSKQSKIQAKIQKRAKQNENSLSSKNFTKATSVSETKNFRKSLTVQNQFSVLEDEPSREIVYNSDEKNI